MFNKNNIEEKLKEYSSLSTDNLYEELSSSLEGLTNKEANKRLEANGLNVISIDSIDTTLSRIIDALVNPFNIVLIIIAGITFLSDVVFAEEPSYITFIIIMSMVLISSFISFIQSEKSSKAAEKLSKMIVNASDVKRNNDFIEIAMEKLVIGDVIKLGAGDMIPADVRFITTKDLFISQASLTGESNPVEKFIDSKESSSLTDLVNIGFMGTNVVSGTGIAIVIETGNNTYFGSMAKSLNNKQDKNSFERGIDSVSKLLIRFMLVMIPIIIIINGLTKGDWLSAILFAISIAVGLTPEMLPVIMTTTLAKGALAMSKHKVIVKNLSSIQTFGEMDILCTDKTGTLTEDRIVLEKYINVQEEDDEELLKRAFMNSYFQTSLKSIIDVAVINRANKNKLAKLVNDYYLVDEIPYDFERRRMSVVLNYLNKEHYIITKGSVEDTIAVCKYIKYDKSRQLLDKKMYKKAMEVYDKYTKEGMRMLAVAGKGIDYDANKQYGIKDEEDMTFIGFVCFLDPPKESAIEAIRVLKENGVRTVVLTGDSQGVAKIVCERCGIDTELVLSGAEVEKLSDKKLKSVVEECNLFYKLAPKEKERVVKILQGNNHTVGYMGDGINDALPLKQADVGVSVDNAVDIAKETADIILLKKDLLVLEEGMILGRQTFGNIIKYIKMATSGNFGNMFSIIISSIFLPFLPMLPVHILVQNLLCDLSQMGIPFDSVDKEFLRTPRKWSAEGIKKFMYVLGPISSIFDCLCFLVLFFIIRANTMDLAPIFQCGWFLFGTISQVVIIHMIRTEKRAFTESIASIPLLLSTLIVVALASLIAFTGVSSIFGMAKLPLIYPLWLLILILGYSIVIEITKKIYLKKYKEWL